MWHCAGHDFLCLLIAYLPASSQINFSDGSTETVSSAAGHTEIEVANQSCYLTQSQYTDTGTASFSSASKTPVCWLVGCLTSQKHASVSQRRIYSDNCTCCHTEIEVANPTFYLTQSQYTDTGLTSPSADPVTPGVWQSSQWSANFEVTGMTRPGKKSRRKRDSNSGPSAFWADALTTRPTRWSKTPDAWRGSHWSTTRTRSARTGSDARSALVSKQKSKPLGHQGGVHRRELCRRLTIAKARTC